MNGSAATSRNTLFIIARTHSNQTREVPASNFSVPLCAHQVHEVAAEFAAIAGQRNRQLDTRGLGRHRVAVVTVIVLSREAKRCEQEEKQ